MPWNNLSPRLGINYDLSGSGKTVLGVTLSRYYGQPGVDAIASTLNPVGTVFLRYPWADLNNDQLVTAQRAEPDRDADHQRQLQPGRAGLADDDQHGRSEHPQREDGRDRDRPAARAVPRHRAQRQLHLSQVLRLPLDDGRRHHERIYAPVTGTRDLLLRSADRGPCPAFTYFAPTVNIGGRKQTLTNRPDYNRDYNGFEVSATKRYSNKWYANASYAYNSSVDNYDVAERLHRPDQHQRAERSAVGVGIGRQRRVGRVGEREVGGARDGDVYAAVGRPGLGLPERPPGLHLPVWLHDGRPRQRRRGDDRGDRTLR